jgi:transmembrane sensor
LEQLEHIKYLYQKYLNNTISDLEHKQLMRFFRSASDTEMDFVVGKLAEENIPTDDLSIYNQRADLAFTRIAEHTLSRPKRQKLWKWLPYVAAILILLGISLFMRKQPIDNPTPLQTVQVFKDLAPGGKRAILTLAGGKTIVLDNVSVGQLAEVDGTRISKTADGQLIYENNTESMGAVQTNTMNIPRGGEYQLLLPDGTKIWLNASTTISYPTRFIGNERRIKLKGEAYFEVAKDREHPFIVETATQTIQVLGTHFNVNTYNTDRAVTTLEEGSVRVSSLRGVKQSQILKPGQQSINTNTLTIEPADLETILAWKNGLMRFKQASLQTVLDEISRWYDLDVVYKGTPPDITFTGGVSRSSNLSVILRTLKLTGVKASLQSEGNNRKLLIEP